MEKIHLLSPLNIGKKLLTDFKKKASVFNKIFGWNYTLITKGSSLPSLLNPNLKSNISFINYKKSFKGNQILYHKRYYWRDQIRGKKWIRVNSSGWVHTKITTDTSKYDCFVTLDISLNDFRYEIFTKTYSS